MFIGYILRVCCCVPDPIEEKRNIDNYTTDGYLQNIVTDNTSNTNPTVIIMEKHNNISQMIISGKKVNIENDFIK